MAFIRTRTHQSPLTSLPRMRKKYYSFIENRMSSSSLVLTERKTQQTSPFNHHFATLAAFCLGPKSTQCATMRAHRTEQHTNTTRTTCGLGVILPVCVNMCDCVLCVVCQANNNLPCTTEQVVCSACVRIGSCPTRFPLSKKRFRERCSSLILSFIHLSEKSSLSSSYAYPSLTLFVNVSARSRWGRGGVKECLR